MDKDMGDNRHRDRGFWHVNAVQEKGLAVLAVLVILLCAVSTAVRILPHGKVDVQVSRMDSLQIIPTVVRADTFMIDLNGISEKELASHPLVRDSLAGKIFSSRVRYGGFVCREQLCRILGESEAVEKLLPYVLFDMDKIVQYDINTDSEDMLCEHPYITRPFARSVAQYREENGVIKDYATLKKLKYFPRSKEEYLKYYINFEKTKEF